MLKIHLRYPRCTFCTCGSLTKNRERIQSLRKQEIEDIFIKMN